MKEWFYFKTFVNHMRNSTIRVELPLLKILGAGGGGGGGVGTLDFKWWGWLDDWKKIPRASNKPLSPPPPPKETMDQKLTPRNSHSKFLSLIKWFYETDAMYYVKYWTAAKQRSWDTRPLAQIFRLFWILPPLGLKIAHQIRLSCGQNPVAED